MEATQTVGKAEQTPHGLHLNECWELICKRWVPTSAGRAVQWFHPFSPLEGTSSTRTESFRLCSGKTNIANTMNTLTVFELSFKTLENIPIVSRSHFLNVLALSFIQYRTHAGRLHTHWSREFRPRHSVVFPQLIPPPPALLQKELAS